MLETITTLLDVLALLLFAAGSALATAAAVSGSVVLAACGAGLVASGVVLGAGSFVAARR